jgi:hypothetical protein
MPQISHTFYLSKLQNVHDIHFMNRDFEVIETTALTGLFSYVLYKEEGNLLIISTLTQYRSNHSGINLVKTSLRRRSISQPKENPIFFSSDNPPEFGGEILLLKGKIVFWNFKSGSYSEKNENLHDESPRLHQKIYQSGLPPERFISIQKANEFEKLYLKSIFLENGQYKIKPAVGTILVCTGIGLKLLSNDEIFEQLFPLGTQRSAMTTAQMSTSSQSISSLSEERSSGENRNSLFFQQDERSMANTAASSVGVLRH